MVFQCVLLFCTQVRKIRKKVLKASDLESLETASGSQDHAARATEQSKMTSSGFRPVEDDDDDDSHSQEERSIRTRTQADSEEEDTMEVDDLPRKWNNTYC